MSISLLSFPNLSQKSPLISIPKNTLQTKYPTSPHRIQSWRAHPPCDISGVWVKPLRFLLPQRKLEFGFSSGAVNGEGEAESVVEEVDGGRGESTMPSRFRYLLKEAPDIPVRWPWLIDMFSLGLLKLRSVSEVFGTVIKE
ncbi:hypothetical protein GIB67_031250 [Kingdonia uniflora]|uniref:Uncharacterized protein n=1 Tax=Kingdonia uniflora TaxID=39325 RepID=A0A7J7NKF3_9MAGN|nr:hypothetical protein GIB67_031250 [Kingdonia uniflora]